MPSRLSSWALRRTAFDRDDPPLESEIGTLVGIDVEGFDWPLEPVRTGGLPGTRSARGSVCAYSRRRLVLTHGRQMWSIDLGYVWRADPTADGLLWVAYSGPLLATVRWRPAAHSGSWVAGFAERLGAQAGQRRGRLAPDERRVAEEWLAELDRSRVLEPGDAPGADPGPGGSRGPVGVLDAAAWLRLAQVVAAVHRGDPRAHTFELRSWDEELTQRQVRLATLYLVQMLRMRLEEVVGEPLADRLQALAQQLHPAWARFIRGDAGRLEDTFRTALELPPAGPAVTGADFLFAGTAALGLLLDHPQAELLALRRLLGRWSAAHAGDIERLAADGQP